MNKENFWQFFSFFMATVAINITICTVLCSTIDDDMRRLSDRVDILTRIVMEDNRNG